MISKSWVLRTELCQWKQANWKNGGGLHTHLWCLDGLAWNGIGLSHSRKRTPCLWSYQEKRIRVGNNGSIHVAPNQHIFSITNKPVPYCPMSRIGSGGGLVQSIQRTIASALKCWISGGGVARNISNKSILTHIFTVNESKDSYISIVILFQAQTRNQT